VGVGVGVDGGAGTEAVDSGMVAAL